MISRISLLWDVNLVRFIKFRLNRAGGILFGCLVCWFRWFVWWLCRGLRRGLINWWAFRKGKQMGWSCWLFLILVYRLAFGLLVLHWRHLGGRFRIINFGRQLDFRFYSMNFVHFRLSKHPLLMAFYSLRSLSVLNSPYPFDLPSSPTFSPHRYYHSTLTFPPPPALASL